MVRPNINELNYSPNHQHKPMKTIRDFKQYRMYVIKSGTTDPKELVFGEVSWRDNIESLGVELNVVIPRNVDDKYLKNYDIIEIGDGIIFKNLEDVIFQGMVEDIDMQRYSKNLVCYDMGYLLNKTSLLRQFSKMKGDKAIEELCKQRGIPIGYIEPMDVTITKIYKNEPVSDIFKDIISQEEAHSGRRLRMEIRDGKLYIERQDSKVIDLLYKPAANVSHFDPTLIPGEITRSDSIADMKNHVVVVFEQTKKKKTNVRVVAEAKDEESIKKYGRRVHIETITKEELKNGKKIANNKLRELTGIKTQVTVELLGDDRLRSGRVIILNNETYKLKGKYLVTNCEQTYVNNNRKMQLEIEGV